MEGERGENKTSGNEKIVPKKLITIIFAVAGVVLLTVTVLLIRKLIREERAETVNQRYFEGMRQGREQMIEAERAEMERRKKQKQ